jgi:hypothetical protein
MSASNFHNKPCVPATVVNLDLATVAEVLARHACNITDASKDLGVSHPIFVVCYGAIRSCRMRCLRLSRRAWI